MKNDLSGLCEVYANIGLALLVSGAVSESKDFVEYSVETVDDVSDLLLAVNVRAIYARYLLLSADFAGAARETEVAIELANGIGNPIYHSELVGILASIKRFTGELQDSLRFAEDSYESEQRYNNPIRLIDRLYELAILNMLLGDLNETESYLSEIRGITSDIESVTTHGDLRKSLIEGEISLAHGDTEILGGVVDRVSNFVTGCNDARKYEAGLNLARFYRGLGNVEEAIETGLGVYEWSKERGFTLAWLLCSVLLCEVFTELERNDEAGRYFNEINSIVTPETSPYWRSWLTEWGK
jgi:tetratricopeptide (TPR) repeat protein